VGRLIEGLEAHIALIDRSIEAARVAGEAALRELLEEIYAGSQERVPVRSGTAKDTGKIVGPAPDGDGWVGAITYGDARTVKGGVDYTVLLEFGSVHNDATHFLSESVMAVLPEAEERMGVVFIATFNSGRGGA